MKIGTFLTGLAFILAGVVVFFINYGYGSWRIMTEVKKLWPVLLIIIGLSFFWRGRIPGWLAAILILMLVGAVVFLFATLAPFGPGGHHFFST